MNETGLGALTYKEIYHQPASFEAINATLGVILAEVDKALAPGYDELIFTGCGTSLYLAQTAAFAYSACTGHAAKALPCSELYFFPEVHIGTRKTLVLPITRKSVTTEVRMAIDKVRALPNVRTLAITCDSGSARYNDHMILSPDADEKSVIMTGTFTSMIYLASILALHAGGRSAELRAMTQSYPALSRSLLTEMDGMAKRIIEENPALNLFITLGQGVYYGVANECMNKMKEMGLSNSEAYYSLEYRHGPMSLVDENTLILSLCHSDTCEQDAALLDEMKGFGAVTAAIGKGVSAVVGGARYALDLPGELSDIGYAAAIGFIGQLLGYYLALRKGLQADTPRHLSQAIVLK